MHWNPNVHVTRCMWWFRSSRCVKAWLFSYMYTLSTLYKQKLRMLIIHTYNKIHSNQTLYSNGSMNCLYTRLTICTCTIEYKNCPVHSTIQELAIFELVITREHCTSQHSSSSPYIHSWMHVWTMLLHYQSTYSISHVCHPVYSGYRRPHLLKPLAPS